MKKAARGERLWDLCRLKTALNRRTSRAAQAVQMQQRGQEQACIGGKLSFWILALTEA